MDDADWRERNAEDAKAKVESVIPFVKKSLKSAAIRDEEVMDSWLISSVHRRVATVTQAMEEMKIRRAAATTFLDMWNDIRYYVRRSSKPRKETLVNVFNAWMRMMAPFAPFMAEDLNHELGNKGLACQADWPALKDFPLDEETELAETVVSKVIEDARNVLRVVKGSRSKLNLYVSSDQARSYFIDLVAAKQKKENVGSVVKKFAALKIGPDRVLRLSFELGEEMVGKYLAHRGFDEYEALSDASEFMSGELGVTVKVQKVGGKGTSDPADKGKDALPMKPAFFLE
jgi:leucyl-tRNA synthetase